jgi:hypothetical protein
LTAAKRLRPDTVPERPFTFDRGFGYPSCYAAGGEVLWRDWRLSANLERGEQAMIAKKTIGTWLMVFFGLLISIFFLDAPIAIFCKRMARSSRSLGILMGDMPDLLLPVAGLATVLAWVGYGLLRRRGINNNYTHFFKLTAVTIPLSYAVKSVLK